MLTVKDWEQIRRAYHVEQKSIRQIARETGRARRTVRRILDLTEGWVVTFCTAVFLSGGAFLKYQKHT